MADYTGAQGWREAGAALEQILVQYGVPANIMAPVVARSMSFFKEFYAQILERAPRNPGLAVPLSEIERAKLQGFYSAYEQAVIQSIVLAVLEVELSELMKR